MKLKTLPYLLGVTFSLMFTSSVLAEPPKIEFPAPSPACTIKQRVGLTDIEITYSRPGVKGREIFGAMVPYGRVWRTGANQATKMVFSTPVKINGIAIPAGTYALMTIPDKEAWTIIINKGSEQWGAYKYDEKADVARIKAAPIDIGHLVETFTIDFNNIRDDSATLYLVWEKTEVPLKLEVDVVDKVLAQIDEMMASDAKQKPYYQAALFYYNHDRDLKKASPWIDEALAQREAHYMVYLKAQILAKLGDKAGAIAAAKRSIDLAEKANDPGFVKLNEVLIKNLK